MDERVRGARGGEERMKEAQRVLTRRGLFVFEAVTLWTGKSKNKAGRRINELRKNERESDRLILRTRTNGIYLARVLSRRGV
jgi:hypothetical protein